MSIRLGRHVFGLAAIGLGIGLVIWQDFIWQIEPPAVFPHARILIDCAAAVQIAGGLAVQFRGSVRTGAIALGIVYGIFGVLWLPLWIRQPLVFDYVGNAFETLSMLAGALLLCGPKAARIGYFGFGVSTISFALYQAVHPHVTASLVPKWIAPGQMFWAIATTIAFALAAASILTRRSALLAARLTTLMLFAFGVLVWVAAILAYPHNVSNWSEAGLTFGICGAAWILADALAPPSVDAYASAPIAGKLP